MIADFYLCPKCLYLEFGEEELKTCPKCGNEVLRVYASGEAQHLIVDVWNDYGSEFASIAAITLAILSYTTSEYPTLSVEIRDIKDRTLREELVNILRSYEKAKEVINVLKKKIEPTEPLAELLKRLLNT